MKAFLPDGTELELEDGASGADAARAIGEGLARSALGIRADRELRSPGRPPEDGARIEAKMREHVKAKEAFEREDVSVEEALERFRAEGQDYKVELIEDLVQNAD